MIILEKIKKISLKAFAHIFAESGKGNRRFCFILGSGASREAGIPTGIEMARQWADELGKRYERQELKELMKRLDVNSIEPNSKNYFGIYDMRFYPDYKEGHAYFERELEKGNPSLGHHALATILAGRTHNLAITTNFDSLIEEALFIYTDKSPLVVGHESLTEFINLNINRPIVAKTHRSLYFNPFNRQDETNDLAKGWQETLRNAFMVYTPVVIGYAGGDQSLMRFLNEDSVKMNGLYWCYWKKEEPSKEITDLVTKKGGCFVPIDGFDQMMFMLSRKLAFSNPEKEIRKVAEGRIEKYNNQYDAFEKKIRQEATNENLSDESSETIEAVIKELKSNNDLLLDEVKRQPKAERTWESYFQSGRVHQRMLKHEEAIADYTKVIELNPNYVYAYNNRGNVYREQKQYKEALVDYTKAIELDPHYVNAYNNRGVAYDDQRQYEEALADYTKAIELDPNYAYYNRGNVYKEQKQYEEALVDYTKAIELNPNDADAYYNRGMSYYQLKEYERAKKDYNKACELDAMYTKAKYKYL